MVSAACAAAGPVGQQSHAAVWCGAEKSPGPWKNDPFEKGPYRDLWPVRPSRIAEALDALRNVTVVSLSREKAANYLGSLPEGGNGNYYLVRSTVYAPRGASVEELYRLAQTPNFYVEWFAGNEADIVTWQPAPDVPAAATNFPLLLRASQPVSHVSVGCFAIR
jgi:hypothetical protein